MNEDLVKRFAPILFLHPEEKFFPVDAKRYLEFANLWSSAQPFSDDTKWGKPGTAPSTRQPVIVTGGLTGVATEPGRLIDDPSLRPAEAEMFLELGGWKNAAGAHETGVTATSSNAYSDRSAIADMYGQEPLLDSRFWYHAEIYDGARLTAMARRAGPPDFSPYLTPNSTLLFYYLFFPAALSRRSIPGRTSARTASARRKKRAAPATGSASRFSSREMAAAMPANTRRNSSAAPAAGQIRRFPAPRNIGRASSTPKASR